ncbi:hypothetical protein [Natrononativus amylolyticus]|uniref:hypothetical protein n=1 Tax=Natrononativus amylolyticus TaxID=2963434 RepID=UPI0020CE34A8|nr:hypothetical protein [Natrononativus amylolyticus]
MTNTFTHDTLYELSEELQQLLGDDLRGILFGDFLEGDYSVIYLHDEVTTSLDPGQIQELSTTLINEQIDAHGTESLEHIVGELTTTVRCFEATTQILAWDPREETGVFVGMEPDAGHISPVIETLRAYELA